MNALNTQPKTLAALTASILLALGCATQQAPVETPSPVDVHWGESYRQAVAEPTRQCHARRRGRPRLGCRSRLDHPEWGPSRRGMESRGIAEWAGSVRQDENTRLRRVGGVRAR